MEGLHGPGRKVTAAVTPQSCIRRLIKNEGSVVIVRIYRRAPPWGFLALARVRKGCLYLDIRIKSKKNASNMKIF